jgi:hypothetical protein
MSGLSNYLYIRSHTYTLGASRPRQLVSRKLGLKKLQASTTGNQSMKITESMPKCGGSTCECRMRQPKLTCRSISAVASLLSSPSTASSKAMCGLVRQWPIEMIHGSNCFRDTWPHTSTGALLVHHQHATSSWTRLARLAHVHRSVVPFCGCCARRQHTKIMVAHDTPT